MFSEIISPPFVNSRSFQNSGLDASALVHLPLGIGKPFNVNWYFGMTAWQTAQTTHPRPRDHFQYQVLL
jgi:hypothetical protein